MKSLLLAAALIAGIVALARDPGHADASGSGRFQIDVQWNTDNIWVVDTLTGRVRVCQAPHEKQSAPDCWAWSGGKGGRPSGAAARR
jgi:hypothetical protein